MIRPKKDSERLHLRRVGLRWGRLLHALDVASENLSQADFTELSPPLKREAEQLRVRLSGLTMAAWVEETNARAKK